MFAKETILVLGAGASMPYGFPSGRKLVDEIITGLSGIYDKGSLFSIVRKKRCLRSEFINRLIFSDCESVDAFLEKKQNQDLVEIGKQSIAIALLEHEREDRFFSKYRSGRRDWYSQLFSRLNEGLHFEEVQKNKISIITFNYDRSLEYYLATALSNLYRKSMEKSQEILDAIPIIHVHGKVGRLPWDKISDQDEQKSSCHTVPFGGKALSFRWIWRQNETILRAAMGIRIIPEEMDDTPEFIKARELLQNAKKIFFLGFGFHPTNIRRLSLTQLEDPSIQCTTLGLSADRHKFLDQFKTRKGNAIFCSKMGTGHVVRQDKDIWHFIHEVGLY